MKYIMTRLAVPLVALLMSGPGVVAQDAPAQRFAFINLDKTFTEYYKTKEADAQLKEQAEEFKTERKKLLDDLEALQKSFETLRNAAKSPALSEDARSTKRLEAEEKLVELREQESRIRRFDESRQKQLEEQSRRMRKRLVEEIGQVIAGHALEKGYTAVVDSSGESLNGVPSIIYTDPRFDITDAILTLLNKGQPAEKSKKK